MKHLSLRVARIFSAGWNFSPFTTAQAEGTVILEGLCLERWFSVALKIALGLCAEGQELVALDSCADSCPLHLLAAEPVGPARGTLRSLWLLAACHVSHRPFDKEHYRTVANVRERKSQVTGVNGKVGRHSQVCLPPKVTLVSRVEGRPPRDITAVGCVDLPSEKDRSARLQGCGLTQGAAPAFPAHTCRSDHSDASPPS